MHKYQDDDLLAFEQNEGFIVNNKLTKVPEMK